MCLLLCSFVFFFLVENHPNIFSLKVYHGGRFTKTPGRRYVKGRVNFVDMIDSDEFSVHEVNSMIEVIGYTGNEVIYYHYKVPDLELDYGLRALGNDSDVLTLLKYVHNLKLLNFT
jgi:hypothetical protein